MAFRRLAGKLPRLPLHVVWKAGEQGATARCFVEVAQGVAGSKEGAGLRPQRARVKRVKRKRKGPSASHWQNTA